MVCLSVYLSVKSHLTSGASVRPQNTVMYSAGNRAPKNCVVFSETAPLQISSTAPNQQKLVSSIISPAAGKNSLYLPQLDDLDSAFSPSEIQLFDSVIM